MTASKRFLAVLVLITVSFTFLTQTAKAADDITGHWHEDAIRLMIEKNIMNGYGDGIYKPNAEVTRGQFAAILSRALKLNPAPAGISFSDVTIESGLMNEVHAAAHAGIITGYPDGTFKPFAKVSRQHIAVMLDRTLDYLEMEDKKTSVVFEDRALILPAYLPQIDNVAGYGIFNGSTIDGKTYFRPTDFATRGDAAAVAVRLLDAMAASVPAPEPEPEPEPLGYTLGYVENGQLVKQTYRHATYESALKSFVSAGANAIYKDNEILHIKNGVAFGNARTSAGVPAPTTVYKDPTFSAQATYVEYGRELSYLDSTESYVKVQIAGTIGYVRHTQVELVPAELATARDFYTVSQWGTLIHYVHNYASGSRGSYAIGPAPAELAQGANYYSADGVHFYDTAGNLKAQHYPYFQYQSVRTKTSYTAEELDAFIVQRLKEINNSSATYKDAVTKSKLIGMGKHFKAIEAEYNVNALFMLAAAIHEGAHGMSVNSQTKNNMFGIKVFDSTPEAGEAYAKPEESIIAFAREYMNKNYANPLGSYANGAAPGNKTSGFNVKYASDPTWGSKIAGHMTKIDNAISKKDYGRYELAMTNYTGSINVRNQPVVTKETLLFSYRARDLGVNNAFGYPLTVISSQKGTDGYTWYKVFSDMNAGGEAWIREDLVRLIKHK